jgi:hypothetical protein
MFVLRFFKILLLVIVAFLFITVAVLFQLNNTLHNTLFSYEYFEENFDRDITAENIEKLVEKAVQDLGKDIAAGESEEGARSSQRYRVPPELRQETIPLIKKYIEEGNN